MNKEFRTLIIGREVLSKTCIELINEGFQIQYVTPSGFDAEAHNKYTIRNYSVLVSRDKS